MQLKNEQSYLKKISCEIRRDVIKAISRAKSGHPAGSLGLVEIFVALYFEILNEEDKLILSNGHTCPSLYATLAKAKLIDKKELDKLGSFKSMLQGHPDKRFLPIIQTTSGPIGSGLAQACGIAYAARMDNTRFRTYVVTSDGEHNEGNHWEAVAFAGKNKLSNLTMFVDRNNIQVDGFCDDIMLIGSLVEKYKAFNWNVIEIDGHNFEEIILASSEARDYYQLPTAIIAKTIPGYGVDFMENNPMWHAKVPNKEETKKALDELC